MKTNRVKTYRQTAVRLAPRDDTAIRRIIAKGFAHNTTSAIRVALQRFADMAEANWTQTLPVDALPEEDKAAS